MIWYTFAPSCLLLKIKLAFSLCNARTSISSGSCKAVIIQVPLTLGEKKKKEKIAPQLVIIFLAVLSHKDL